LIEQKCDEKVVRLWYHICVHAFSFEAHLVVLSIQVFRMSATQHVWECFLEFCFLQRNLWCLGVARCSAILFLPRQMTTWKVALCFSHITSYVPVHVKRLMPTPAGVIYLPLHLSRPPSGPPHRMGLLGSSEDAYVVGKARWAWWWRVW